MIIFNNIDNCLCEAFLFQKILEIRLLYFWREFIYLPSKDEKNDDALKQKSKRQDNSMDSIIVSVF